jgi:phosphoserine phosphatase
MTSMTITRLALFDLDHTLLPIDSADVRWHFLVRAAERGWQTMEMFDLVQAA